MSIRSFLVVSSCCPENLNVRVAAMHKHIRIPHSCSKTLRQGWQSNSILQWNLSIMDTLTLGPTKSVQIIKGVLIFQVSLHDNVSFGTTARCVDYAGVHIFKCPD